MGRTVATTLAHPHGPIHAEEAEMKTTAVARVVHEGRALRDDELCENQPRRGDRRTGPLRRVTHRGRFGLVATTVLALVIATAAFAQDTKKRLAETTTETVLEKTGAAPLPAPTTDAETATNPTVDPGAVRWHDDLTAARAASRESGKPVLLFQLLGRLDQEFC